MQLKSRYVLTALVLLVAMTMAAGEALAQASITVASTPTSRQRNNDHTALVGDITLTVVAVGANPAGGTITLDYQLPITNNEFSGPAATSIEVVGTGCFLGTTAAGDGFPAAADDADDLDVIINHAAGSIVLQAPGGACVAGDAISIQNVHATVAGAGISSLNANVSASPGSGFLITAGQNNPTVISSILDPLVNSNLDEDEIAIALQNGLITNVDWAFDLEENFFDALGDAADLGAWALNDVQVRFTFAGLPAGVTLTNLATSVGSLSTLTINNSTATGTTLSFAFGDLDPSQVDEITISGDLNIAGNASLPLPPATITVNANIFPTGSAFGAGGAVIAPGAVVGGGFPRFASDPTATIVVASIVPAQTTMVIPFAATGSGGFDSGISIANTTEDNFGPNGAIEQDGPILFEFYPTEGTPFSYTTSATSPGSGLTNGIVESGDSYVVLLSELLDAAGQGGDFLGYIFVTTNFTNAHGDIFITDFAGFTSSGNVLVMSPPAAGYERTTVQGEGLPK